MRSKSTRRLTLQNSVGPVGKFTPFPVVTPGTRAGKTLDDLRQIGVMSIVDAKTAREHLVGYRRVVAPNLMLTAIAIALPYAVKTPWASAGS